MPESLTSICRASALATLAACLAGCGSQPGPQPSASATPTAAPTPAPTTRSGCEAGFFWYHWSCSPAAFLGPWGLGQAEVSYLHNDPPHGWYVDQGQTGPASENNCGPAVAVMAARWRDASFPGTVEEARQMFPRGGGWWYVSDILAYLEAKSIPREVVAFVGGDQISTLLANGHILLLCLNTQYLRRNTAPEQRVDRFYNYASGHFIIVKGMRQTDSDLFLEAYDSNNWSMAYSDLTPKGRNRHYRAADIQMAATTWWAYLVVIEPATPGATAFPALAHRVDPAQIPDAWGR